jgi:hypothetical protein
MAGKRAGRRAAPRRAHLELLQQAVRPARLQPLLLAAQVEPGQQLRLEQVQLGVGRGQHPLLLRHRLLLGHQLALGSDALAQQPLAGDGAEIEAAQGLRGARRGRVKGRRVVGTRQASGRAPKVRLLRWWAARGGRRRAVRSCAGSASQLPASQLPTRSW